MRRSPPRSSPTPATRTACSSRSDLELARSLGLAPAAHLLAPCADRNDLEIAGEDDVVYGDIVKTIELAAKVGFSDWKVRHRFVCRRSASPEMQGIFRS